MVSLIAELETRETAARVRVEELEAEIAELTSRLAGEREVRSRLPDAELSLPTHMHSHGLRRLAVLEAVRGSYDQAKEAIDRSCGRVLGKRQAELLLVVAAAVDVDDFHRCRIPLPSTAATALVMQVDGKGVFMRPEALRPATLKAHLNGRRALRTRLAPGEKPHRKRMATLACVFDADPPRVGPMT